MFSCWFMVIVGVDVTDTVAVDDTVTGAGNAIVKR